MLKPTTPNLSFSTLSSFLAGALYAAVSILFFAYFSYGFQGRGAAFLIGELIVAAGACTIVAALWNSASGRSWLLAVTGLVCTALGLILAFWRGPVAFRTIALLIVGMAGSLAVHELQTARLSHQPGLRRWIPGAACVIAFGFSLAFLGFALRLIPLRPSPSAQTFLWIGCYFGFSAACMLGRALPWRGPGLLIFHEPIAYPY